MQINAAITTQLLLSFFNVKGVVHYGIAGNANPNLNIGDVTIPQYWAHLALWNWQVRGSDLEMCVCVCVLINLILYIYIWPSIILISQEFINTPS